MLGLLLAEGLDDRVGGAADGRAPDFAAALRDLATRSAAAVFDDADCPECPLTGFGCGPACPAWTRLAVTRPAASLGATDAGP